MKTFVAFNLFFFLMILQSFAHCDTRQGPVSKAAEEALNKGNVNIVLVWVQKDDEKTIRDAFEKALKMRKDPGTRKMADDDFLETLVRIHRAGEGMPYTGIKEEAEPDPGIAAADKALESGSLKQAHDLLSESMNEGLEKRFSEMMQYKNYNPDDVEAGRKFVASYVTFMHYVEGLYAATKAGGHHEGRAEEGHGQTMSEGVHGRQGEMHEGKMNSMETDNRNEGKNYLTNFLIIAGVLIVVAIQIIILRRK
jgi:hypothetical protein